MIFALTGNPNCGKTTLFNQLTGSRQHAGNFPGVTVDKKEGPVKNHENIIVVDLPGIYSLSPYTSEEIVTRDFLIKDRPDAIINIVDATNIERSLYLTLQLADLNIPVILALNMMDEVTANGGRVDIERLSELLGIAIAPVSASKNQGVEELIRGAVRIAEEGSGPSQADFYPADVRRALNSIARIVEEEAGKHGVGLKFAAVKLMEGDERMMRELEIQPPKVESIERIAKDMEFRCGMDRETALADARYNYIADAVKETAVRPEKSREYTRSANIDRILTHRIFAIPIFLTIMLCIFWITFGAAGAGLSDAFAMGIDAITGWIDKGLACIAVNGTLRSLLIDGVCAGVGSVLSFLPTIVLMFFLLSILEDSGYMARVAFVMDRFMRTIGLSGRSFVPMLTGFGCSVPAIMATRTLSGERDRRLTAALVPFMSCSAKLPVYATFVEAFFADYKALVMFSIYLLGIIAAIVCGVLVKKFVYQGEPVPFIMELPAYRFPAAGSVLLHMWEKAKGFVKKAFTVIFLATIVIWLLQSFDIGFNIVRDSTESMLSDAGRVIAPLLEPTGLGDWRAAAALITGLSAKEAVISTLSVLAGAGEAPLTSLLPSMFTPLEACCFLVFCLLYTPCAAAVATARRELGGRAALCIAAFQTGLAWIVTFIFYHIGLFIL